MPVEFGVKSPPSDVRWDLEKMWMGHGHKDLTDQYAEQLREDAANGAKRLALVSPYPPMFHNFRNQDAL